MAIKYRHQSSQVNRGKPKFEDPGHYTKKDREKIKHFAGPNETYPIEVPKDVADAAKLYGHAANPDAVKRKIISIAHELGPEFVAQLPDDWTGDGDSARATKATVTRAAESIVHIATPSEIRIVDEEQRIIEVCATSEAVDTFGTIFSYDASKDAFRRWLQTAGNVREMHKNEAVGKAIGVREDDDPRKIWTRMRISKGAPNTWEKIKDGTLGGASIGASNVQWVDQRHNGQNRRVAVKYDLVELSLVDNASNPDAQGITIIRAAQPDMAILAPLEETPPVSIPTPQADAARVAAQPAPHPGDFFRARQAKAERAARAGERAETEERRAHPRQQHETEAEFIARAKAAAGAAEAMEMIKIAEEERAAQASVQAVAAPSLPPPVTPQTTRDAAPASPAPAGVTTATGLQPYEMDNAVATDVHIHDHKHRHTDGTVHAHPHMHDHGAAHRAVESDETPHADHYHVYRAGKPIDARLANAEDTRLPASQQGSGAAMPGPRAAGDATVWDNAQPSNPVKHITAKSVGHRVDYNTEDVEATEFGVPDPEEDRPTPGDDGETLTHPADMFHEGGEWPEATKLTGGHYDFDGDDDGGDGGDAPVLASRPPAPTVPDASKNRPTPGNRAKQAEETRIGARNSAADTTTMHGLRDDGLKSVRELCNLCGCDGCKAMLVMLSPQEGGDDEDGDEDETDMRMQVATFTRAQHQTTHAITELVRVTSDLVAFLQSQGDVAGQLSDLSATLADTQRLSTADATRAATQQQLQLAETTRAIADTNQLVRTLASCVEGVAAGVARIEATPVGTSPASAPLAELKRLAMDRGAQEAPTEQRIAALTDAIRSYSAQHPNDPNSQALQMEAFAAVFNATNPRR